MKQVYLCNLPLNHARTVFHVVEVVMEGALFGVNTFTEFVGNEETIVSAASLLGGLDPF
jgi:hypothetical protein